MATENFETHLFDLDGTLIDSIELIFSSYRHTLREHRGLEVADAELLAGLGTPLWTQLGDYTDDPRELDAMVATYRAHNASHHDDLVRPYEGTREAVEALGAQGIRLGIVTSKSRDSTVRGLQSCGFDPCCFEVMVCSDDLDVHKPAPDPVLHALRALDVSARGAVFSGDSPHDLESGRRAGVSTAAVGWGPFPREVLTQRAPDFWLDEPRELLLLERTLSQETRE